jgi:hypothetical protein
MPDPNALYTLAAKRWPSCSFRILAGAQESDAEFRRAGFRMIAEDETGRVVGQCLGVSLAELYRNLEELDSVAARG